MKKTAKQKRVEKMIEYLRRYVESYSNQKFYLDYQDETIINDMIYGLGVALDAKKYSYRDGFDKFQKYLIKHLQKMRRSYNG